MEGELGSGDVWIIVPLDADTNEVIADVLVKFCRAYDNISTDEGFGYIVPSDLFKDQPSAFIKQIEAAKEKFNLRFSIYRQKKGQKPERWPYSFSGASKKTKEKRLAKKIKPAKDI